MRMPGVSAGTRNIDMPRYGLTSGLVTAMTIRKDAVRRLEEKNFSPLMTHSSPDQSPTTTGRAWALPDLSMTQTYCPFAPC